MDLTDEQLYQLTDCAIWDPDRVRFNSDNIREELVQLKLLSYHKEVIGPWQYRHIWKLTDLGYEVLEENRVRAITLLQWYLTICSAFEYFKYLTIEELPLLLVHNDKHTRLYAKERMEELLDGTA